jgi:hypothetical protein
LATKLFSGFPGTGRIVGADFSNHHGKNIAIQIFSLGVF